MSDPWAAARQHYRHNLIVHTVDAGFFGLGLGFSSFVTLLPLFLSAHTESALAIGLIAVMHPLGWHLPQLLTARRVAGLRRRLPMVLTMTANERLPFFALAMLAYASTGLSPTQVLIGTYILVLWIGLGGGLTGTAFQSMVSVIVPPRRRGIFYGAKTAAANLCLALGAIVAGRLLGANPTGRDFALCFGLAGLATLISWIWLAQTREPDAGLGPISTAPPPAWMELGSILRQDLNFRRYLVIRVLSQLSIVATAFYAAYAIQAFGMSGPVAGRLTAVFAAAQVVGNLGMGAAGDRLGYRPVMAAGMATAGIAAATAAWAPGLAWFYLVFALAGLANVAAWTLPLAMTLEFGNDANRAYYIGLANTLIAPAILLGPLLGGWMADAWGYRSLFGAALICAIATALLLQLRLRDPEPGH